MRGATGNVPDPADALGLVRIFPREECAPSEFWPLAEGATIGRDDTARIRLDDDEVAARHARLVREGSSLRIRAEPGAGPIRIDGVGLSSGSAQVSAGSLLRCGNTLLLIVDERARYRTLTGQPPVELSGVAERLRSESTLSAMCRAAVDAGRGCAPALLLGEPGVGKKTLARLIHQAGPLRQRPLVSLDPRVIPPEVLDAALFGDEVDPVALGPLARSCGTIFIERVDSLDEALQAKLARALARSTTALDGAQDRMNAARLVASAETENPFLVPELAEIFARCVFRIPPLRARRDEILTLALDQLEQSRSQSKLDVGAAEILAIAEWPRNVSELREAVAHALREAAAVESQSIRAEHLPPAIRPEGAGQELPSSCVVRVERERGSICCFGEYEVDADRFELRRNASVLKMQPRVFDLLLYLVRNAGRVISRNELLAGPWHGASVVRSALNQAIMLLRRTLEAPDGTSPIKTVRQRGFQLDAVVTVRAADSSNQNWQTRYKAG